MIPGFVAETAMATTLVSRGATLCFAEVLGALALWRCLAGSSLEIAGLSSSGSPPENPAD